MITLINPPGNKTFSGLQMHTTNPRGLSFDEITARIHPDAEDRRYARWFVDRFYTRRRWHELAETAHR